ncbi:MAG: nitrilase-related carbon-nitrogen hydrolase [Candidatus Micrarchaeota archaeon]
MRQEKADVWLFPHLFSCAPGADKAYRLAEPAGGPTPEFLLNLAREKKAYCVGSYLAKNPRDARRPFIRSIAFNPEGVRVASYEQVHLSSIAGEPDHFTAGKKLPFFDVFTFRSAMISSYDLRFPELAREFALSWGFFLFVQGAFRRDEIHAWDAMLCARAAENQMFVIGANFGCHKEGRKEETGAHGAASPSAENPFGGHSAVYDPTGKKIHQAGEGEQVLILDIDPFQVEWNRNRFQYLTDSRMKLSERSVYESVDDPDK